MSRCAAQLLGCAWKPQSVCNGMYLRGGVIRAPVLGASPPGVLESHLGRSYFMSDAVRAMAGFRRQEKSEHLGTWGGGLLSLAEKIHRTHRVRQTRLGTSGLTSHSPVMASATQLHRALFPSCERGAELPLQQGFPACSTDHVWTDEPLSWGASWALQGAEQHSLPPPTSD